MNKNSATAAHFSYYQFLFCYKTVTLLISNLWSNLFPFVIFTSQDKMQQLLAMLAKLVQALLQKLPYWWKLPIVLMIFYQFQQRDYLMNNNLFDSYPCEVTGPKFDCQDPVIGKYIGNVHVNNCVLSQEKLQVKFGHRT